MSYLPNAILIPLMFIHISIPALAQHSVAKPSPSPLVCHIRMHDPQSSGFRVLNEGTMRRCKNSTPTFFYAIAFAKAVINGQWQYAGKTRSENIVELRCGT